jgi:hypothetical protein
MGSVAEILEKTGSGNRKFNAQDFTGSPAFGFQYLPPHTEMGSRQKDRCLMLLVETAKYPICPMVRFTK